MRWSLAVPGLVVLLAQQIPLVPPLPQPSFEDWLSGVRAEALTRGISEATVDQALAGLEPVPMVIHRDRTQAEIVQTLDRYLGQRVSKRVIATAQTMRRTHRDVLKQVSEKYGVPASILVSIWGLESNFGRFSGVRPTIATLATLAYDPRRSTMFRQELLDALKILDSGDVEPGAWRGSWAGALGQPQFMPSTYLQFSQDFDGDGRRDIWSSQPDVFASVANYLREHGWTEGTAWGREVRVPKTAIAAIKAMPRREEGCRAERALTTARPLTEWRKLGLRTLGGAPLPAATLQASMIGDGTRYFLVYHNYEALLAYNCATSYAISVGMLADRLK
jgi:membrane-bound lytic murein transglycosylase B